MAIWASAGACGTGLTGVDTHIYMDDRSFWTDSIQKVERQIKRWQAWSTVMGLLESPQKTKVVARGQRQREQLHLLLPSWTDQEDARILGAVTVSQKRKYHPIERGEGR